MARIEDRSRNILTASSLDFFKDGTQTRKDTSYDKT